MPTSARSRPLPVATALAALGLVALLAGAAPAGPVTVDLGDSRWLRMDGAPLFLCGPGDPEDFLHRGARNPDGTRSGDQDAIIQKLAGTGANTIWMTAVRSHGGDGGPLENPFVDGNPALGVAPAVLDQWEGWISALDAAGIVTLFVFYDDGSLVWNTGSVVGSAEAAFLQMLVDRFEAYDRVIWCVCEEYQEAFDQARVSAIAATIALNDDRGHAVAAHQWESSQFHFPNDPVIQVHPLHTGYDNTPASLHAKVTAAWSFADGRYHVLMAESIHHWTDRTSARRLSWAAALGGAPVMVHDMNVADTPIEGLEDCGRLATFFASIPFETMEPRDDLARGGTDWVFGHADAGWVVYAADPPSAPGLALPVGAEGAYTLRWLDPATGVEVVPAPELLEAGDHTWAVPGGIGPEAVLCLLPAHATPVRASIAPSTWARMKGAYRTP